VLGWQGLWGAFFWYQLGIAKIQFWGNFLTELFMKLSIELFLDQLPIQYIIKKAKFPPQKTTKTPNHQKHAKNM
jgi:hypothetical protein